MNNEEVLQKTLSATLERLGKQATAYEVEIANLNAQIIMLNSQLESLAKENKTTFFDVKETKDNKKESK
jgi:predicted RNase H-like nuclease (RuvC/YqgF family)